MIELINVSSRGQIVIPQKVREQLGIETGSKLLLVAKNGEILLKKEEEVTKHIDESARKENLGWMALAEKSLQKVWDNPKDEKAWRKYL